MLPFISCLQPFQIDILSIIESYLIELMLNFTLRKKYISSLGNNNISKDKLKNPKLWLEIIT